MKLSEIRRFVRKANFGRPLTVEQAVKALPKERDRHGLFSIAACLLTPEAHKPGECVIIVFPAFFNFGKAGKLFVLLHEVGHLYVDMQEQDFDTQLEEEAANCWARERAREMGIRIRRPNLTCIPELGL